MIKRKETYNAESYIYLRNKIDNLKSSCFYSAVLLDLYLWFAHSALVSAQFAVLICVKILEFLSIILIMLKISCFLIFIEQLNYFRFLWIANSLACYVHLSLLIYTQWTCMNPIFSKRIFLSAIWMSHHQLWVIIRGQSQSTDVNHCLLNFDSRLTRNLLARLVP